MTVSTTSIGNNTIQITISGETSSANILTALDSAIVNNGWEQHDVYNNGTQRVYRSLCKDGVTFKYFGMFFDPIGGRISTTCYESWNKTTHVGTNEVATYNRTGQMHYTLNACDIIVMISPRWLVLQTFIRNNPGPWAGVFECSREAAEDTPAAGFPPFMWITSVLAATSGNNKYASFPRSRANGTGVAATADGWQTQYIRLGAQTALNGQHLVPMTTYAWDTSKKIVQSMRPTFGSTELHGKVFGLKAVSNIGAPYSKVSLPIDSDYQFSVNGTPTEHWVLANTPGFNVLNLGINPNALSTGAATSIGTMTLPGNGRSLVFNGSYFYVACSLGIAKIDGSITTLSGAASNLPGVAAVDHRDITTDGRYVYASTSTGITRIDTTNDEVTTLALPIAVDSLFYDGANLWAATRVAVANGKLYRIDPTTFTLSATLTVPTTANGVLGGMCTDFAGNIYLSSGDSKLFKIEIETNTVTLLASPGVNNGTPTGISFTGAVSGAMLEFVYMNGAQTFVTQLTTAGTVVNNGSAMTTGGNSFTTQQLNKFTLFKIGCFEGVAGTNNGGTQSSVMMNASAQSGLPAGSGGTFAVVANNLTSTSCFSACDGGRFYSIMGTYFTVLNNVCHPDDGTTPMNRYLLPK